MNNPLVSIITPVYYGEDTLERAIRSAIEQDFPNWEMIIISDDGRNYEKIVRGYGIDDGRLRFTSTDQISSGESNARNKGLEIAKGQYISCLDCDDAFKPQKLSTLIPLAKKYGAAISSIDYRDSETNNSLENLSIQPTTEYITPQDVFREHPIFAKIKNGVFLITEGIPITHYQKASNYWLSSKLRCTLFFLRIFIPRACMFAMAAK